MNDLNPAFWQQPPEKIIEWQDPESDAKGFLVINALINGACGGGTRVSLSTNIKELTQLAKIMQLKFAAFGPAIGGAKSGIVMDPSDPKKYAVLKRWFAFIEPWLKTAYGTASDLNTDFSSIQSILKSLGIAHPQYGIIQSIYKSPGKINQVIDRMGLLNGIVMLNDQVGVPLAQLSTGFLIAQLTEHAYQKQKKDLVGEMVVVQGVGTVGSAAAYYLQAMGAKVIGLIDKDNGVINQEGFSKNQLSHLVKTFSIKQSFSNCLNHENFYLQIQKYACPIFIPAAGSYLVDKKLSDLLINQQCRLIVGGANIPFASDDLEKIIADKISVIPSYISSGGVACAFNALLQDEIAIKSSEDIFNFIKQKARSLLP